MCTKSVSINLWSDVEKIIGGILPLFEDEIRVGRQVTFSQKELLSRK